ncbi:tyrosine-type recombinase/integrase [Cruoricaptor ignavus]|nr:site-specific integrase [Cruoricaptor ignavus]
MRKQLKELPNGCSRTEVYISPKNYKTIRSKSQMPKYWFVECRFFDPKFSEKYPNGFQYRRKFTATDPKESKLYAEVYKEEMEKALDELFYNPITKEFAADKSRKLHPGLLFFDAIKMANEKISPGYKSKNHGVQVRWMLSRIKEHLYISRLFEVRISDVRTWHIKNLLDIMDLTPSVYNRFRSYLMRLFTELVQYGCVEHNFIRDISKQQEIPKVRAVMSPEKFDAVFKYLEIRWPNLFRYAIIFHYSGARSTELMKLKAKDVDLAKREFQITIIKGHQNSRVKKAIIPSALPYWESLMSEVKDGEEFLFSRYQKPGKIEVDARTITVKWRKYIKNCKEIKDANGNIIEVTEDFYSLKHLFLDKLDKLQHEAKIIDINLAQGAASHTSSRTTSIYTVGSKDRAIETLKRINIK